MSSFKLLAKTYQAFNDDKAPAFAAALAFFTIFSIAPLSILIIGIVSLVLGQSAAQGTLTGQLGSLVGPQAAQFVQDAIKNTNTGGGSLWATVVGAAAVVFGATGVVSQLKDMLNTIWGIKPVPKGIGGVFYMVWVKLLSLLFILLAGILLLVFLLSNSLLYSLGSHLSFLGPAGAVAVRIGYYVLFLLLVTLLFGLMYKFLPDGKLRWKDVWIGGLFTAVLFVAGGFFMGLYFGRVRVGSVFGAGGSLVLILLWIFYSAQIFLFGAEFTQVRARSRGRDIEPGKHTVRRRALGTS
jgi:membrane protein